MTTNIDKITEGRASETGNTHSQFKCFVDWTVQLFCLIFFEWLLVHRFTCVCIRIQVSLVAFMPVASFLSPLHTNISRDEQKHNNILKKETILSLRPKCMRIRLGVCLQSDRKWLNRQCTGAIASSIFGWHYCERNKWKKKIIGINVDANEVVTSKSISIPYRNHSLQRHHIYRTRASLRACGNLSFIAHNGGRTRNSNE